MFAGFAAVTLMLVGAAAPARAAVTNATQIAAALTLRPLTPTEINTYALTNVTGYGITNGKAQVCSGLSTVGLGEPVYVDAMASFNALTSNTVIGVAWTLAKPTGSSAALAAGFLGTNVPLYKTSDKWNPYISWVGYDGPTVTNNVLVNRIYFRPDVSGQYTVTAIITNQWKTSVSTTNLSVTIYGATYLGLSTCASCHSGYFPNIVNTYSTFTNTPHASFFARAIDGLENSHYSGSCISCHVVGYDTYPFAVNGGFDDLAKLYGWTFPTVLTNSPSNWTNMPSDLQNLANIQCENCHGPGSEHVKFTGGIPANTNAISKSYAAADCSQCHDSMNNHYYSAEWNNSLHAASAHQTGSTCVRCHTGPGFVGWANAGGMSAQNQYPTNVIAAYGLSTNILTTAPSSAYEAITCQACHDPHDASNPHQLRLGNNVVLSDGTVVTNAGAGGICMQCHNIRYGSYTNMMATYPTYNGIDSIVTNYTPNGFSVVNLTNQFSLRNNPGGSNIGTHDSPQADLFEGVNAETYGKAIACGPHANVVSNTCAGCHMQTIASTDPAFTKAGGHTFKMSYTNGLGAKVAVTAACTPCHGTITNFDMLVPDYAGIGQPMGIQSQVQVLLKKLSALLPPRTYQANPANYASDGLIKVYDSSGNWTDGNIANYTNLPMKYLKGYYNYDIVYRDNSWGVHNAQFAVGLLKASIANLTGDANNDNLPDAWQTMVYGAGFATNPAAAYNAFNNGYPNWVWASMNLNPLSGFQLSGNNGAIYISNGTVANGQTNFVVIFKAAEIAFNTQVGITYTIQAAGAMTGGWANISTNIPGTGYSVSYCVPTRFTNQMFYRVAHTP